MDRRAWLLLISLLGCRPALAADAPPAPQQHVVVAGDTLVHVAGEYGVTLEALRQANPGVDETHLLPGTSLLIPGAAPVTYQVSPGDTLYRIARRFSTTVADLKAANGLTADDVTPGQVLHLPSAAGPAPSPAAPAAPAGAWVQVRLADGTAAWAPRDSLLLPSSNPMTGDQIVALARRLEGVPYVWGGTTPNGVDCSGFVQTVYSLAGYTLPRTADVQFQATQEVPTDQLQPGDLVFFTTYLPGPSHVGIYAGQGRFIHASSSHGVTESVLTDPYFGPRFLGGRRLSQKLPAAAGTVSASP